MERNSHRHRQTEFKQEQLCASEERGEESLFKHNDDDDNVDENEVSGSRKTEEEAVLFRSQLVISDHILLLDTSYFFVLITVYCPQ